MSPRHLLIEAAFRSCFSSKLPQSRHPESSASQIYRVVQRLERGVEEPVLSVAEGTPAMLVSRMLLGAFEPLKPAPDGLNREKRFPG